MERIKVKNKRYVGQAILLRTGDGEEVILIAATSKTLLKVSVKLHTAMFDKNKIDRVAMRLATPEDE